MKWGEFIMKKAFILGVSFFLFLFALPCFPSTAFAIDAPKNLTASQESPVSPKTIGLHWSGVSGAKGYVIYDNGSKVKDVGNVNSYHLGGVSKGKHNYTVSAYDQNNKYSEKSNVAVVKVRPAATITKCSYENGKVEIEWKAPTEGIPAGLTIARFEILRKDGSNKNLAGYKSVASGKRSFTDNLVAGGGVYEYAIGIRWSDNSYSALSTTHTVTIPGTTGTKKETKSVFSKLMSVVPSFHATGHLTGALSGTGGLSVPKLSIPKFGVPKFSIAKLSSLKGFSASGALRSGYNGIKSTFSQNLNWKNGNSLQGIRNLGQGLYDRLKNYVK